MFIDVHRDDDFVVFFAPLAFASGKEAVLFVIPMHIGIHALSDRFRRPRAIQAKPLGDQRDNS